MRAHLRAALILDYSEAEKRLVDVQSPFQVSISRSCRIVAEAASTRSGLCPTNLDIYRIDDRRRPAASGHNLCQTIIKSIDWRAAVAIVR